jgi:hypothetical protein
MNMKRSTIIGIVIIIILALLLLALLPIKTVSTPIEARINSLKKRMAEIRKEITVEIAKLHLDKKMKLWLDQKIQRLVTTIKFLVLIVFVTICALFVVNGYRILDAILMTSGLIGIALVAVPLYLANKVMESNDLIQGAMARIRLWVYNKYNFDPSTIQLREETITARKDELNVLEFELSKVTKD